MKNPWLVEMLAFVMVWALFQDRNLNGGANQRNLRASFHEVSRSRMAGPPASDDPTL